MPGEKEINVYLLERLDLIDRLEEAESHIRTEFCLHAAHTSGTVPNRLSACERNHLRSKQLPELYIMLRHQHCRLIV